MQKGLEFLAFIFALPHGDPFIVLVYEGQNEYVHVDILTI